MAEGQGEFKKRLEHLRLQYYEDNEVFGIVTDMGKVIDDAANEFPKTDAGNNWWDKTLELQTWVNKWLNIRRYRKDV